MVKNVIRKLLLLALLGLLPMVVLAQEETPVKRANEAIAFEDSLIQLPCRAQGAFIGKCGSNMVVAGGQLDNGQTSSEIRLLNAEDYEAAQMALVKVLAKTSDKTASEYKNALAKAKADLMTKWHSFSLKTPLAFGATVIDGDNMILVGGSDGKNYLSQVIRLRWTGKKILEEKLPALPKPLALSGAAILGKNLYVIGGVSKPYAVAAEKMVYRLKTDAEKLV